MVVYVVWLEGENGGDFGEVIFLPYVLLVLLVCKFIIIKKNKK